MHAAVMVLAMAGAAPMAGPDYEISWWTIDGGGGTSAGGSYSLSGTIGQHDAGGPMSGGAFELVGGFWAGAVASCAGDFNGDGQLNILDFVCFQSAFQAGCG